MKNQIQQDIQQQVAEVQHAAETWTPQHALSWAFDTFGENVAISSAFGAEGMVLIDMASRVRKDFRIFTVDTEFLFPETYNLMDRIEEKYGVAIEKAFSVFSPEEQERAHGTALWTRDPDLCCSLRKVEPLRRKLSELSAWITSIRRDQTSVRSSAHRIEWDCKVRAGEDQSNGRLDFKASVALHPRPRRTLQHSPQPGLSQYRLHALHARRASGRRSSGRALARIRQD